MSNLEYNGQVLTKARRELKLKADDVALELCLSVQQVQAIENNLNAFFHSNQLKQAVIKRYCQFLGIDVNTVVSHYEADVTDNSFQDIKKNRFGRRLKTYFFLVCIAFISTTAYKILT